MALSEIKTNIQKQETKDEPQTNGSYKMKKIIKIITHIHTYTHTHTHTYIYIYICTYTYTPISKVKTAQQNKVQQIDLVNKGNQKLYLPVKSKTN